MMAEVSTPNPREHDTRGPGSLHVCLAIAGGIALFGLIALVVASSKYGNPLNPLGAGCADAAWPDVASAITLLTLIPAGVFALAALTRIPLI